MKGRMKWKKKNRFSEELLIENPPQIHMTNIFPIYGIIDIRLIITVAPHNDICPQRSTLPRKTVAIESQKIVTPDIQVYVKLKVLYNKYFVQCVGIFR